MSRVGSHRKLTCGALNPLGRGLSYVYSHILEDEKWDAPTDELELKFESRLVATSGELTRIMTFENVDIIYIT
jgi:hypothetical protein